MMNRRRQVSDPNVLVRLRLRPRISVVRVERLNGCSILSSEKTRIVYIELSSA